MNMLQCTHCGRFSTATPPLKRRCDLLAMMQGAAPPSEPHQRAERTKAARRSERRWAHVQAMLAAGVVSAKATARLEAHGHGR